MKRLIVKLKNGDGLPEDFELPGEQVAAELVTNLVTALNLPKTDENRLRIEYWLDYGPGRLIRDEETLSLAGVVNGGMLVIRHGPRRPATLENNTAMGSLNR